VSLTIMLNSIYICTKNPDKIRISGFGVKKISRKSGFAQVERICKQYPPLCFFTGRMPFLPPNQQRQSTEGTRCKMAAKINCMRRRGTKLRHSYPITEFRVDACAIWAWMLWGLQKFIFAVCAPISIVLAQFYFCLCVYECMNCVAYV